jgi:hypothetical protein
MRCVFCVHDEAAADVAPIALLSRSSDLCGFPVCATYTMRSEAGTAETEKPREAAGLRT